MIIVLLLNMILNKHVLELLIIIMERNPKWDKKIDKGIVF